MASLVIAADSTGLANVKITATGGWRQPAADSLAPTRAQLCAMIHALQDELGAKDALIATLRQGRGRGAREGGQGSEDELDPEREPAMRMHGLRRASDRLVGAKEARVGGSANLAHLIRADSFGPRTPPSCSYADQGRKVNVARGLHDKRDAGNHSPPRQHGDKPSESGLPAGAVQVEPRQSAPHQGDVLESEQGLSALRLDTALATTSLERAGASGRTSTAERVTSSWLEHSVVVAELQLKTQQKAKNLHERFQSRFAM